MRHRLEPQRHWLSEPRNSQRPVRRNGPEHHADFARTPERRHAL